MTNGMESPGSQPPLDDGLSNPSNLPYFLLKYPKSAVDDRINYWLHQSCPAVMSPPSDTHSETISSLGDSTYEFIDTDEESRDETGTASIASTDFGRPDDVASLPGTEQSDDEDSESESPPAGGIPAFRGLDDPEDTPTIGQSAAHFQDEADRTLAHSIEFEEPESLGDQNVSVKHTVADFSEIETARIAERMMLRNPPKRLVATIRQTMTRQGLSIKEPLRILYVGCHTAKQDIIRKIASSVAASVGIDRHGGSSGHRTSQLYHVVPITAFGSEKPPEIELMESSGYQINVEDCTSATSIKFSDGSGLPDVLRLTLDGNYAYHSIPEGTGFTTEPTWELPHVAIFYCSENDTAEMIRTRTVAKNFMSRHKVPSIVISHNHPFEKSFGRMTLDQHAIHMCLESRDPNSSKSIMHQRLPIDLDSFKTIDARQMNRNLAYLTGLHEPLSPSPQGASLEKAITRSAVSDIEKTSYSLNDSVSFIKGRTGAEWRALIPVGILLLSVFAAVFTGTLKYHAMTPHAVSVNGNLTFTEPTSVVPTTEMTSTPASTPSVMTSTETRTSTRTITITHNQTPVANSLAVKQSMELGRIVDESQTVNAPKGDSKMTMCYAKIVGEREVLIGIPLGKKMSWLSEEPIAINVSRGDKVVEVERLYKPKEGIILQFSKEEAYGVMNISIATTKKPNINKTFQVNFGTKFWTSGWMDDLLTGLHGKLKAADSMINNTKGMARTFAESIMRQSFSVPEVARQQVEEVGKQAAESSERVTKFAKALSMDVAKWSAIISKEVGMQVSEAKDKFGRMRGDFKALKNQGVREPVEGALLRAQVQSKLFWLKLQGRHVEYREYEVRAAKITKQRAEKEEKRKQQVDEQTRNRACKQAKKSCHKRGKSSCAL